MDLLKAMRERHSVRSYNDKPIEGEVLEGLYKLIEKANAEKKLNEISGIPTEEEYIRKNM